MFTRYERRIFAEPRQEYTEIVMGGYDFKHMHEVNEVTTIMKDTISCMQKSVENLHGMEKALNEVARVRDQLEKVKRDALDTIITADDQVNLAVHFARIAVRTCKSIVERVRRVITAEKGEMSQKLNLAIRVYAERVKDLMPKLEKARDELAQVQVELKATIRGLKIVKSWYNRNISEMEGKTESEVVKQGAIAYGGAAGTTADVAGGMAWWNPVGWVAIVIGGEAAAARGVAAGVTEGKSAVNLKKEYFRRIISLNEVIKLFEAMSKNTEESVGELHKKTTKMQKNVAVVQQNDLNGEITINIDVGMFDMFKEDIFNLEKLCDDYLNAPDMDHHEKTTKNRKGMNESYKINFKKSRLD